jgi:hypothetical protein
MPSNTKRLLEEQKGLTMFRTFKRRAAIAAAAVGLATAAVAAPAAAEFSPPYDQQCSGAPIKGLGTSLGTPFWVLGAANFSASAAPEACPVLQPTDVDYAGSSSGAGLSTLRGARDPEARLVGTAEAPGPVELALIEEGSLFTNEDDAEIRTIPQYVGAVAVIVNFPEGCTIPEASAIGSGTTQRFQVPNATLEAALAGSASADTWGELLPGIGGEGCAAKPVMRVVRDERAGATLALKRWLATVNSSRGWNLLSTAVLNTVWPKESVNLVRANGEAVSGNVNEATKVVGIDGSIGYASLDAARANGFSEASGSDDDNYWIPLYNASGALTEPAQFAVTSRLAGANCAVTFTGVPSGEDPTRESWRNVSAAATETGYPVCALGYAMAWDDAADAYGSSEQEQARQRMLRDYLGYQLSDTGQLGARGADQRSLPEAILAIARAGQQQLGWSKP